MEENRITGLMKLGKPEDMERLYREGEIYMRRLAYFKELDGDKQRADEHEGSFMQKQVSRLFIEDSDGKKIELKGRGTMHGHYEEDLKGNVYCMYAFTIDLCAKANTVDPKNHEFGSRLVLIYNVAVFIERMLEGLRKEGFEPHWDLVEYYDETDRDDLDIFNKPIAYEHQNELRFFVENTEDEVIKFNIGSLEDISEFYETEILNQMTFNTHPTGGGIIFNFPA